MKNLFCFYWLFKEVANEFAYDDVNYKYCVLVKLDSLPVDIEIDSIVVCVYK